MSRPSDVRQRDAEQGRLYGFDLVRGVAALCVLVYHSDFMFGQRGALVAGGYTAVDLFFILSGFVIARTYERGLLSGRVSMLEFAKRRLARLYPLYFITTVVGLFVMTARFRANQGHFDWPASIWSAVANVLLLPTLRGPYGSQVLFPFNAASWSVFYEVVVNAVYAFALAPMRSRRLLIVWAAFGLALGAVVVAFGSVDVGWGLPNMAAGGVRVAFSFTSGVLIWRAFSARPWSAPWQVLLALILAHICYMQGEFWLPKSLRAPADLVIVAAYLPLVVATAAATRLPDVVRRAGEVLGDMSYSVYLTQDSLIIAAAGFTQALLGVKIYDLGPMAGLVFVSLCMIESYLVFRYFETPARNWIRRLRVGGASRTLWLVGNRRGARRALTTVGTPIRKTRPDSGAEERLD